MTVFVVGGGWLGGLHGQGRACLLAPILLLWAELGSVKLVFPTFSERRVIRGKRNNTPRMEWRVGLGWTWGRAKVNDFYSRRGGCPPETTVKHRSVR